jgi:hypothetical protein
MAFAWKPWAFCRLSGLSSWVESQTSPQQDYLHRPFCGPCVFTVSTIASHCNFCTIYKRVQLYKAESTIRASRQKASHFPPVPGWGRLPGLLVKTWGTVRGVSWLRRLPGLRPNMTGILLCQAGRCQSEGLQKILCFKFRISRIFELICFDVALTGILWICLLMQTPYDDKGAS